MLTTAAVSYQNTYLMFEGSIVFLISSTASDKDLNSKVLRSFSANDWKYKWKKDKSYVLNCFQAICTPWIFWTGNCEVHISLKKPIWSCHLCVLQVLPLSLPPQLLLPPILPWTTVNGNHCCDYYLYYNHCHYYCHCCSHCYHYCCLYESKFCSCLITLIWSMREVKLLTICTNGWLVRAFLKNNQSINGSDFSHTLHKNSYRAQALTHKCNQSHGKWFMPSRNMQCEGPL